MEFEIADVCFFVFLLFVEAFLEFAVLLEATLLSHLALFLFCLNSTALGTEILDFTVEHLIFAELTLQRTIVNRNLDAGLEAYLVKAFLAVGEYPGVVARKLMFQALANHLVSP